MTARIAPEEFYRLQPALPRALLKLGEAIATSGLEASLIHLVTLRASQINHCAYCQHRHANEARRDGERQERLDVLSAWREVAVFTRRERAALNWCEALTLISQGAPTNEDYDCLAGQFSREEIANLTAVIVAINGWNRIAVSQGFAPDF